MSGPARETVKAKVNDVLLKTSLKKRKLRSKFLNKTSVQRCTGFPFDLQFNVIFSEKSENIQITLDNREISEVAICICPAKKLTLNILENPQENTLAGVSFLINSQAPCNFLKKETTAEMFHCQFCETFKSNLFTEHLWAAAS